MSIPVSVCLLVKAVKDPDAFNEYVRIMKYNLENYGHWTTLPCSCSPPCTDGVSPKEWEHLCRRYAEAMEGVKTYDGDKGKRGFSGSDKLIWDQINKEYV